MLQQANITTLVARSSTSEFWEQFTNHFTCLFTTTRVLRTLCKFCNIGKSGTVPCNSKRLPNVANRIVLGNSSSYRRSMHLLEICWYSVCRRELYTVWVGLINTVNSEWAILFQGKTATRFVNIFDMCTKSTPLYSPSSSPSSLLNLTSPATCSWKLTYLAMSSILQLIPTGGRVN